MTFSEIITVIFLTSSSVFIFCIYLLPFSLRKTSHFPNTAFQIIYTPLFPSLPPFHSAMVPFYFRVFYSSSRLCTHIGTLGARSLRWERTCEVCLSGTRLPYSIWSCLVPSIHQQISWFHFLHRWIGFHNVYVPHFHYPSSMERHLDCFNFLAIVTRAAMNSGLASIWGGGWQVPWAYAKL